MHTDIFRGEVLQYLGIVLKYYRNLANVKSYYIQMIDLECHEVQPEKKREEETPELTLSPHKEEVMWAQWDGSCKPGRQPSPRTKSAGALMDFSAPRIVRNKSVYIT